MSFFSLGLPNLLVGKASMNHWGRISSAVTLYHYWSPDHPLPYRGCPRLHRYRRGPGFATLAHFLAVVLPTGLAFLKCVIEQL